MCRPQCMHIRILLAQGGLVPMSLPFTLGQPHILLPVVTTQLLLPCRVPAVKEEEEAAKVQPMEPALPRDRLAAQLYPVSMVWQPPFTQLVDLIGHGNLQVCTALLCWQPFSKGRVLPVRAVCCSRLFGGVCLFVRARAGDSVDVQGLAENVPL